MSFIRFGSTHPSGFFPQPGSPSGRRLPRFAGQQYKIMSYNVETFNAAHIGKDPKRVHKAKQIAEVIQQENPDVIAFQEVGGRELLQEFNQRFLQGQYPNIVQFPTGNNNDKKVALMSKKDLLVESAQSHWSQIVNQHDNSSQRDLLEATFRPKDLDYRFTVLTSHFTVPKKENHQKSLHEANVTARVLQKKLAQDPEARIVLTGDFNAIPGHLYGQQILDQIALKRDDTPRNDLVEASQKQPDQRIIPTTGTRRPLKDPTQPPGTKLDHALISPQLYKEQAKAHVAGREYQQEPWQQSDHFPLVTIIEAPDLGSGKDSAQSRKPHSDPARSTSRLNRIA